MRIPDSNGDFLLFRSPLISVIGMAGLTEYVDNTTLRIEDHEGVDITGITRIFAIHKSTQREWAELEIDRPGFEGAFSTQSPPLLTASSPE